MPLYHCHLYISTPQNTATTITVLTPTVRTCRCLALETYAATFAPHQQIPTGMSLSLPNPEGGPDLKVGSWLKKQRQRRQVRGCGDVEFECGGVIAWCYVIECSDIMVCYMTYV